MGLVKLQNPRLGLGGDLCRRQNPIFPQRGLKPTGLSHFFGDCCGRERLPVLPKLALSRVEWRLASEIQDVDPELPLPSPPKTLQPRPIPVNAEKIHAEIFEIILVSRDWEEQWNRDYMHTILPAWRPAGTIRRFIIPQSAVCIGVNVLKTGWHWAVARNSAHH